MCGRFTLTQSAEAITEAFDLSQVPDLTPRYNIAPSQLIATIVQEKDSSDRQLQWMRWGLIPSWAKDEKIGNRMINARVETLSEKPSFRNAFKRRRCLIVADGFYEWQKTENHKQPYYIGLKEGQLFGFAGLWETWQPETGEMITSCTIITTQANDLMQPIHDRMPLILSPDRYDDWLDPNITDTKTLQALLTPYNSIAMKAIAVSSLVNNPANNQAACVNPL